jgi:hypothetical protein
MQRPRRTTTGVTRALTLRPSSLTPPVAPGPPRMLCQVPPDVNENVAGEGHGDNQNGDARPAQRIPSAERDRDNAEDEVDEKIQREKVVGGGGQAARNRVGRLRLLARVG